MTKSKSQPIWRKPFAWFARHNWHKHPFVIPVVMLLVLFFVSLGLFVTAGGEKVAASDSHLVVFSHDKKQETLPTRAKTVGEFLDRVNVKLNQGDVVEPSADTEILDEKFRINIYRARPVTIIDNGRKTFAFSAATTPRSVATQAGVQVYAEDKLDSQMETNFLKDGAIGEKIVIDRATPTNLNLYGTQVPIRTHAKTVGDLLKEKQVVLAKDDTVQPALETPITAQSQVFVVRNGSKVVTEEQAIPMETQTIQDPSLSFGSVAVRQQGAPGKRLVTYQVDTQNGREVGRKEIQAIVAQEPVKHIVARGLSVYIPADKEGVMAAAGISRSDFAYVNYIVSHESGWNAAARNPSGAFGLCQALPGSKMATAGADWATNPVTQLRWCNGYAVGRYGSWAGAYNYWLSHHYW
jgi:resuscitation-promoting factor RpfB